MKVIYNDPDGRIGTYHPELGYLESGRSFELEHEVAKVYIKSGLLKIETHGRASLHVRGKREGKDGHIDNRA